MTAVSALKTKAISDNIANGNAKSKGGLASEFSNKEARAMTTYEKVVLCIMIISLIIDVISLFK